MNIRELIQRVRNRLNPHEQTSNDVVMGFLHVLENVRKDELTCSEIYRKLDEYVEKEVDTKDAAHVMPLIREHLDLCPDCCEEYEALLKVVDNSEENKNQPAG